MVVLVGAAMILFDVVVSEASARKMELFVAAMLVVLGAMNLREARHLASHGAGLPHDHDHDHGHGHGHGHTPRARGGLRPFLVGTVHGLAGSAAVTLLALTTIQDRRLAVAYLALFGLGTVVGMAVVTSLVAIPMRYAAERFAYAERRLVAGAGVLSVVFGIVLAIRLTME
jgi:high-affinity nickel-transport protein